MLCCECANAGPLKPEVGLDELLVKGKPEPGPCIKCGRVDTGGHSMCQSCFDSLTKAGRCMRCGGHTVLGKHFCPTCVRAMDDEDRGVVQGPVVTYVKDEATEMWNPLKAQDKSLIWEDCPACAAKHLAASYAAVTSPDFGPVIYASQTGVLVARALIAIRECESGYSGNAAIAAGCLALAETLYGGHPDERKGWRDARLLLLEGKPQEAEELLLPPSLAALAAGHIAEALRELPELADRTCVGSLFSDGNFEPDTAGGLRDWLRESIGWIMKTHELGVLK